MSDPQVHVINHPLVQHKLTLMRRKETPTALFRRLMREISMLMAYEVTRDLPMVKEEIETPLVTMSAPVLEGKKLVIVSILRAGDGLANGIQDLMPAARVGHIGLYRDPKTLIAVEYYFKMPEDIPEREVLVVDPMLATGNSAAYAVDLLIKNGVDKDNISFMALLGAPEGITTFRQQYPDLPIYIAALDEKLDDNAYIIPGLGDAGDRLFGTAA